MDGRRMGARAMLLVVLGAWHAVVLFALMPRPHRAAAVPGFVSVMLRLDPLRPTPPPAAPLPQLSPAPAIPWESLAPRAISRVPEEPSGAEQPGTPGATIDWSAEAARAARSAGEALPVPEDRPDHTGESYWTRRHEKGEQVPVGPGRWMVWVSERCYTIIDTLAPSAAGLPMAVRCPRAKGPIDAEALLKRRPRYLDPLGTPGAVAEP